VIVRPRFAALDTPNPTTLVTQPAAQPHSPEAPPKRKNSGGAIDQLCEYTSGETTAQDTFA